MSKPIRSFFPAILIAALCLPAFANAQTDPGSLDLLGADFAPLQEQQSSQLNSPLIMGPQVQTTDVMPSVLELAPVPPPPVARLETPKADSGRQATDALVLPDLTIPTPENTQMGSVESRRSLKPQFEVQPQDQVELLPYGIGDVAELRPQPRLQSPQALNYGSQAFSSRLRNQLPIQVEFFSMSSGLGYQPYGGYRSSFGSIYRSGFGNYGQPSVSYRPYGGYVPYGGYGRGNSSGGYCPNRR